MRFSSTIAVFAIASTSVLVNSVAATPFRVGTKATSPDGEVIDTLSSADSSSKVVSWRRSDNGTGVHAPGAVDPQSNNTQFVHVPTHFGSVGNQNFGNSTPLADTFAGPISDMTGALAASQTNLAEVAHTFESMQQVVNNTDSADDPQLKKTFTTLSDQMNKFAGDTAKMMQALSDIKNGLNKLMLGLGGGDTGNDDSDSNDDSNNDGSNDNKGDDSEIRKVNGNDDNNSDDILPF